MNISTIVNLEDSQQNAFVQDWISQWCEHHIVVDQEIEEDRVKDYDAFQSVLEMIQETYSFSDHDERNKALASGGDIMTTLTVLGKLIELTPDGHELSNALNLSYAFVNACRAIAQGDVPGE